MIENKLGFGLMRLPKIDGKIDIDQVKEMVDAFIAKGFTYFDTAYAYPGAEAAFRLAVATRYPRESYTIATKMAAWELHEAYTPLQMFEEQLGQCGVAYFDYYLLHNLQPYRLPDYEKWDCWTFCQQMKAEGRIKNFGFSFHGNDELLDKLLTEHPEVDFVQLQINYLDWNSGIVCAGKNYQVARKHGKPIVVMEPVKGGMLANIKPELMEQFKMLDPYASTASFALRYAASLEGVMMVLSGMSDSRQMEDNLHTFTHFNSISNLERTVIHQVRDAMLDAPSIGCTNCRYCTDGCPQMINIPEVFKCVNELLAFGEHVRPHLYYNSLITAGLTGRASACVACKQCETTCPQHLPIIALLKDASKQLDKT